MQKSELNTNFGSTDTRTELTGERDGVPGDGKQVIRVEHENDVTQDECHLKKEAFGALWRQQEAEEVQHDKEEAGEEEIDHVQGGPAPQRQLESCPHAATSKVN